MSTDRLASLIGKRVSVLDKGWVELQDMMGDDLAIVNAARVSLATWWQWAGHRT